MIKLFDAIIYKEHFIMLPGDEIVEKKHKNIKHLMAMDANTDLSKRATRKFPGLGQPIFEVDFEKEFVASYRQLPGVKPPALSSRISHVVVHWTRTLAITERVCGINNCVSLTGENVRESAFSGITGM